MISLSITRTALPGALSPLVITGNPAEDLWLDENVGRPQFQWRKRHAPESDYVSGQVLLSAVLDQSAIPLTVYARGVTTAALDVTMVTLEQAVAQFTYSVTLTVDGVAKTYQAECTWPQWSAYDSGEVAAHLAHASLVIPVNPPGA